jgi:hypothetical protein
VIGGLLLVLLQLTVLDRFDGAERVRIAVAASDVASSRRLLMRLNLATAASSSPQ